MANGFSKAALAGALLLLGSPLAAQNADSAVDVTAAPPATSGTVGPAQLQNFSLNGTVTRSADRPATQAPTPTQQQQPAATAQPARTESAPTRRTASVTQPGPAAASPDPGPAARQPAAPPQMVTPSTPTTIPTQPVSPPSAAPIPVDVSAAPASTGPASYWPWIAVLVALVGGGAFIAYSRRQRHGRYGDPGRMAFAGPAPDVAPEPPVRPRADPVPPRIAQPQHDPVPAARPKPADSGLIVSSAFKPQLSVEFQPDRAVVTERDVMIQFDVIVYNGGSAPARDVLVEARMVGAHAQQDREIGLFFQNPIGKGDRIAGIPPLGKIVLKSAVRLPLDQLPSFQVEGRQLFVPLVAFNVLFNGEGQESASFLVGRGNGGDEKLAPFRLDLGPRVFRGLSSRPHSMGLQR